VTPFRRSELCALEVADLTEVPDGLRVLIRRSKTDQEGQGAEIAIRAAGPVFRSVSRGGRVSRDALEADSAARIVKRYGGGGSASIPPPTPPTASAAASSHQPQRQAPRCSR
jgi:hypothetical protein